MKTQHTPGPWHAEQNGELPDRPWTVGKLFYNVADVGNEADARLIASTPQLLEALERILSHQGPPISVPAKGDCWGFALPCELVIQARTAIAKAKGETL